MIRMIRGFFGYWADEIAHNWLLVLPIVAFVVSVGMNAATGYKLAGWALCAVLFSVAIFTTYAGTVGPRGRGAQAAWLLAFLPIGLVVDQIAVWQSLGISMADGQVVRAREAVTGDTLAGKLDRLRAERAALGQPRPVAAIQAEENLECSRVSRRYPDGVGPKCTALRAELAGAERARRLDEELIPQATQRLADAPATAGGAPQYEIPMLLAQVVVDHVQGPGKVAVTAEHVDLGVRVLLAVVISFLANLGFWLIGYDPGRPGGRRVYAGPADPHGGADWADPDWDDDVPSAWPSRRAAAQGGHSIKDGVPVDFAPAGASRSRRLRDERPDRAALGFEGHSPSSAHAHGAPISIYLGQPAASGAHPQDVLQPAPAPQDDRPDARQHKSDNTSIRAAHAAPDAPPVDRSRVANDIGDDEREAADVIASFAAACLEPTSGGIVSARDVYRRYCAWARDRAVDEEAFVDLLGRTTGWAARPIGGIAHVRGVALRMGEPMLEVVA